MAYGPASNATAANPPVLLAAQPVAFGSTGNLLTSSGGGGKLWMYNSTHLQATVCTSDFISDGQKLGMKVNDVLLVVNHAAAFFTRVTAVASTYTSLSAGFSVSSAS